MHVLLIALILGTANLGAEDCKVDLAICDRAVGACDASESKCQEQRKADQEAITMLLKQRNEAIKDSLDISTSLSEKVFWFVIGTAVATTAWHFK